ncbi:Scr1 family TA system antitoxin-like transcriptional regulator [Nonomuraea aurantiaca]|uniref:Scr1 family TA system antitoxin-like transcriptional regulator n=1 Tax=Nonomuraea aurantiaca TaxID=2878562 RepID=UPI003558656F
MLLVLVDAGVLRRRIGGPELMREQLGHLQVRRLPPSALKSSASRSPSLDDDRR